MSWKRSRALLARLSVWEVGTAISPVESTMLSGHCVRCKRLLLESESLQLSLTQCRVLYGLCSSMSGEVLPYSPPEWALKLKYFPKTRVHLAMANTPVYRWNIPGVPAEFTVSIKRDDMTGSTLTGNKVRKLEFLLADALDKGCKHVITCGAVQSNHCRAVAVAARQLGLTPHLILRSDKTDIKEIECDGNALVDRMCGAHMYIVPKKSPYLTHLKPRMETLAQHIKSSTGEESYHIPVGGSNQIGLFGYMTVIEELRQQGALDLFDDMVFACGSGGTAAGLGLGNYLTGSRLRLHGIAVSDNAEYFYDHCNETLKDVGMGHLRAQDLLRIVDGYKGRGYGISTDEELEFLYKVSKKTAIILDPVYSGKTAFAMVKEMQNNATAFKGRRVLFIHTGGVFGIFDGRLEPLLEAKSAKAELIKLWPEVDTSPL